MPNPTTLTTLRDRLRTASGPDELRSLVSPLTKALTAIAGQTEYPSIAVLVSDALGFKCSGAGHVEVGAALALVTKLLPGWSWSLGTEEHHENGFKADVWCSWGPRAYARNEACCARTAAVALLLALLSALSQSTTDEAADG